MDETTDVSVNKLLCICIKYQSLKHGKFISSYLGLIEVTCTNARGMTDAILTFMQKYGLNIKNMVGIATEGESVMEGKKNHKTAQSKPHKGVCHSLDIVANKAMAQLPSNLDYIIRGPYNWFSHSNVKLTTKLSTKL